MGAPNAPEPRRPETPMWRRYLRFLGPDVDADVDDELHFHLTARAEALMAAGMDPAAARAEAARRMGDVEGVRRELRRIGRRSERSRRVRERVAALGRDARLAARGLRRAPGFTAIAVLTLALGTGAATAVFTLLDRVALRPLAYPAAERLVHVDHAVPGVGPDDRWGISRANFFYYGAEGRHFEDFGVYTTDAVNLTGDGPAERVPAALASASLLRVLGARPLHGRLLDPADNAPGAERVAVIGHGLWVRRFNADPSVVGRTLHVHSAPLRVVGVLRPGVELPEYPVELWMPLELDPAAEAQNHHFLHAVGRLRPGSTPAGARADLAALARRLPERFPGAYDETFMRETGFGPRVVPLRDYVLGSTARVLWLLLGAVGVVLLIACANVANLFLVRGDTRRREVAVRAALGARRGDLARPFAAEALVVALAGGAAGAALAWAGIRLLVAMAPEGLPRLAEVRFGGASFAFALGAALLSAAAFGLGPLLRARGDLSALRDGGRTTTGSRRRHAVRSALVVGQVALALVLLAGAGLMLRTFRNLQDVHPGLDPRGVLTVGLALPYARYDGYAPVAAFYRELSDRVAALPGVTAVGATTSLPFSGAGGCSIVFVEDRPVPEGQEPPCVRTTVAAPGYFRAMGIAVRGGEPGWTEVQRGAAGVVVSRALAERFWPGEDPIGKGIKGNASGPPYYRVVGVTGDVRADGLDQPPTETVYFPVVPAEGAPLWQPPRAMTLTVRTSGGARPEALTRAVRGVVAAMDPEVPLAEPRSMERVVAASMARVSFLLLLLAAAAGMALVLSAVGLYGMVSYVVGQRRAEIGIRMALGARIAQVGRMVVLQSVRLVALGVVLGLAGALAATRALASLLYEVRPNDPGTLAAVSALLVLLAVAASWLPARRAARVDPAEVLRAE